MTGGVRLQASKQASKRKEDGKSPPPAPDDAGCTSHAEGEQSDTTVWADTACFHAAASMSLPAVLGWFQPHPPVPHPYQVQVPLAQSPCHTRVSRYPPAGASSAASGRRARGAIPCCCAAANSEGDAKGGSGAGGMGDASGTAVTCTGLRCGGAGWPGMERTLTDSAYGHGHMHACTHAHRTPLGHLIGAYSITGSQPGLGPYTQHAAIAGLLGSMADCPQASLIAEPGWLLRCLPCVPQPHSAARAANVLTHTHLCLLCGWRQWRGRPAQQARAVQRAAHGRHLPLQLAHLHRRLKHQRSAAQGPNAFAYWQGGARMRPWGGIARPPTQHCASCHAETRRTCPGMVGCR